MDTPLWFLQQWIDACVHSTRTAGVMKKIAPSGERRTPLDFYSLVIVEQGSVSIRHGDEEFELVRGDMILLQPGLASRFTQPRNSKRSPSYAEYIISVQGRRGPSPLEDIQLPVVIPHPDPSRIDAACEWLIETAGEDIFQFRKNSDRLRLESWIMDLITVYLVEGFEKKLLHRRKQQAPKWIIEVRAYLRENFREPITMVDLQEISGYSAVYLTKEFKKAYHVTPVQYLRQWRLQMAASFLVAHPEHSVHAICMRTGFSNRKTFERAFKDVYGVSPKRWSEQGQKNEED